jgi:BlaI family transcriptional regulator, penicillinase repressor
VARLGDLERKVMDVLWSEIGSEQTVREVEERLPGYAYTTLLTVVDRLQRKGFVRRVRDGRAFRYAPMSSREDYGAQLMREALGIATDRDAVLVRFAETVSPADAAVLREALGAPSGDDVDRGPRTGRA